MIASFIPIAPKSWWLRAQNTLTCGGRIFILKKKKIDFISLINIRPTQNNRSMDIENSNIKKQVEDIIKNLLF